MPDPRPLYELIPSTSFLEYAFLRWILGPAVHPTILPRVQAQRPVEVGDHRYLVDYEITGECLTLVVELDGFAVHSPRSAFSYDRLRQNDLTTAGRTVVRFSYDSIRQDTRRCVEQLQAILSRDPVLAPFLVPVPMLETPDMNPDPLYSLQQSPAASAPLAPATYFDNVRGRVNQQTLRECQREAFAALGNYFGSGGLSAACVMSVGAGKTALGVAACLAFTRRRALVITPGKVIRGTFDRAFDHEAVGNALYGLPGGPLIPGCLPPKVRTLDRDAGAIRGVSRHDLLGADVVITNFHSLGTGTDPDDILAKLMPEDVDLILVDEAHIAAAESYQRAFRHFAGARTLLLSACFQRLDGRPIDADVVYRYRLIDSIADGNAKNLRVQRFAPDPTQTTYELVWPDGSRQEIVGRDAILDLIKDERKLSRITAKSTEPIRQVMRSVRSALDRQAAVLAPVKPRALFAALGERHAEQVAAIAEEHGIPCGVLHHTMTESRVRDVRDRFEQPSGDIQAIVQLKMLGQGYDFPPICVVVPMRPYGSFSEFYQFVGRGIRFIHHPALTGRVGPEQQFLDVIYHAELGLDDHVDTIYRENDMDPRTLHELPADWGRPAAEAGTAGISGGRDVAERPEAFVLFEAGTIHERVVHDAARVEQRREEREREALAQRYAAYAQGTPSPVTFEQFVDIMKKLRSQ